ncbi:aminoglycoside phosphotransferase family protein [Amycolatopsis rubida]|uniref:Aminoglycoside phosphotransferase family protein n=2 Tax=Pseudonocardiaceae TaxID=2070 RepID=A0ABX0BII3_9PSEU|nr:aminoglycoside phosphotransferase family protein [Amycolatopsis rubida]MYW90014.1 phosphotransferase [Amycolatopsis rubida]NEC54991.1 aminoglycoside phosphotransferase family protein [Amycolatopsis rubida]OAP29030.1 serine/threonine protein kinase [Amycolatopsis sp. M39]
MHPDQAKPFTADATRAVLEAACDRAGLDAESATLLRLGENALYRLSTVPVVVRIARTMQYWQQVGNEVAVAGWLADAEFPAVNVVSSLPQPLEVAGHPVTFWNLVDGRDAELDDVSMLAGLLRKFHRLSRPSSFTLPMANIYDRVSRRLETASVPPADKKYLLDKFRELRQEADKLSYPLAPAPVHGDAHIKNVMITGGKPLLIDFECVGWGQPEWDLAVTATEYVSAGFWTGSQYSVFADAYGFDVTGWSGFDVLRQLQEIKMTTWLMQNVNESADIAEEFSDRMRTIRTGRSERPWKPY